MLGRGIRAVRYARVQPAPHLVRSLVWRPGYLLERSRQAARKHLLDMLGDKQAIPPDQGQVFTHAGVNHLMRISGLHITFVESLALLLVLRLWRKSESLP